MTFKGILWNARGWRTKDAEIIKYSSDYDLICVTETKSKRNDRLLIPGFSSYLCNNYRQGEGGAGGVAIFIRYDIKSRFINLRDIKGSFDMTEVRIVGEERTIKVIVVYRRPGVVERIGAWRELLGNIDRNEGVLIVGDFNAHNTAWNCETTDTNGERLLSEFEDKDMFVVNFDTLSRIGEIGQRNSNLDLIWYNSKILDMITYQMGEDSWGLDHYPVFFKCDISYRMYLKRMNRITSLRTDWEMYAGLLEDREYELDSEAFRSLGWEDKYNFVIDSLKKAAFEATGKLWSVLNGRVVRFEGSGKNGWQARQSRKKT